MIHKNLLSGGLAAMPMDSDGVPFNMSHIYARGNVAADMYCNVAAESTGRVLAVRLFNAARGRGHEEDAPLHDRARHHAPATSGWR